MNTKINQKVLREFGILLGIAFPFLIGWIIPNIYGHDFKVWTLFIGIPSLLVSIFKPKILYFPYRIWMKIGDILGFINSHVILGLVFFIVLLPISIFMKIFGYDPLKINKNNNKFKTYRIYNKEHKINFRKIF